MDRHYRLDSFSHKAMAWLLMNFRNETGTLYGALMLIIALVLAYSLEACV